MFVVFVSGPEALLLYERTDFVVIQEQLCYLDVAIASWDARTSGVGRRIDIAGNVQCSSVEKMQIVLYVKCRHIPEHTLDLIDKFCVTTEGGATSMFLPA